MAGVRIYRSDLAAVAVVIILPAPMLKSTPAVFERNRPDDFTGDFLYYIHHAPNKHYVSKFKQLNQAKSHRPKP